MSDLSTGLTGESPSFVSGYRDGGFIYQKSHEDVVAPRTITNDQALHEIRVFSHQLSPLPWAPDKGMPYLDSLPDGSGKVALAGLLAAVDYFAPRNVPIAGIVISRDRPRVIIGDLLDTRSLESCYRKMPRGVTRLSLTAYLSKARHDIVYADQEGIIDIDSSERKYDVELPVDWFEYLPHIDGTTDYTVRHSGIGTVVIAGAVRPMLREQGLGHLWEQYLRSSHS